MDVSEQISKLTDAVNAHHVEVVQRITKLETRLEDGGKLDIPNRLTAVERDVLLGKRGLKLLGLSGLGILSVKVPAAWHAVKIWFGV